MHPTQINNDPTRVMLRYEPAVGFLFVHRGIKHTVKSSWWNNDVGVWEIETDGDDGRAETQDHSEGRGRGDGDNVQAVRQSDVGAVHKTRPKRNRKKARVSES